MVGGCEECRNECWSWWVGCLGWLRWFVVSGGGWWVVGGGCCVVVAGSGWDWVVLGGTGWYW